MASPAFDAMLGFFTGGPQTFEAMPEQGLVSFSSKSAAGPWTTFVRAFEEEQQVAVYGVVPFTVGAAERAIAAELLTRINFGLVIGNFEMDFADGEIRCKTSVDFEGNALTPALLSPLIHANVALMQRYIIAFVAIAARGATAEAALALVEQARA